MSPFGRIRAGLLALLSAVAICADLAAAANAYTKEQKVARADCRHRDSHNACVLSSSTPCVHYKRGKERDAGGWVRERCMASVRDTSTSSLRSVTVEFYFR
jgi:hypothetical protein